MSRKPVPLVVKTVVVTEVVALLLAFIIAGVARNSGGEFSLASRFIDEPGFLVEMAVSFGIVSTVLSGFALAFLASQGFGKVDRRK